MMNQGNKTTGTLRSADLMKVLSLSDQLQNMDPGESFSKQTHLILQQALGNIYFSFDTVTIKPFALLETTIEGIPSDELEMLGSFLHQHPLLPVLSATSPSGHHISTLRELAFGTDYMKTELHNECYLRQNITDQGWISLRDGNECVVAIFSRDADFTDQEISMLQLLETSFSAAWKNWKRVRKLTAELTALQNVHPTPTSNRTLPTLMEKLTRRQRQVAELVAFGKDNKEIADNLKIAPATVGKHLENIFLTLNIQRRTELAIRWIQDKAS
jgi:DNA-binding CsgD family transcriptional regulator